MTSVYPTDEKPNLPPSYEQAVYYPQGQQTPSLFDVYSTTSVLQPQPPPFNMYPSSTMIPPPQAPPVGNLMFITTQPLIYGDLPIHCICPHCQRSIVTRVEKTTGLISWLICGGLLFLGGWLGCCLIPFCVDSLKDTEHYCPNCAVLLGTRRRM